jgi:hypothetical protein
MSRLSGEKLKRIGSLASFAAALTVCFGLECMDRFAMYLSGRGPSGGAPLF